MLLCSFSTVLMASEAPVLLLQYGRQSTFDAAFLKCRSRRIERAATEVLSKYIRIFLSFFVHRLSLLMVLPLNIVQLIAGDGFVL